MLGVIREQRRGGVSLAKELDAEHQCRGRRGHMATRQMEGSRSCPMRIKLLEILESDMPWAVFSVITCGLLSSTLG